MEWIVKQRNDTHCNKAGNTWVKVINWLTCHANDHKACDMNTATGLIGPTSVREDGKEFTTHPGLFHAYYTCGKWSWT